MSRRGRASRSRMQTVYIETVYYDNDGQISGYDYEKMRSTFAGIWDHINYMQRFVNASTVVYGHKRKIADRTVDWKQNAENWAMGINREKAIF